MKVIIFIIVYSYMMILCSCGNNLDDSEAENNQIVDTELMTFPDDIRIGSVVVGNGTTGEKK